MAQNTGRQPDFDLVATHSDSDDFKGKVGAGWRNANGAIFIRLNPYTTLTWSPSLRLALFERGREYQKAAPRAAAPAGRAAPRHTEPDPDTSY